MSARGKKEKCKGKRAQGRQKPGNKKPNQSESKARERAEAMNGDISPARFKGKGAERGSMAGRRLGGERMSAYAHRMLIESIEAVAERRGIVLRDPERNFTRLRAMSLADVLCFLVFASEDTTSAELCDYFDGWRGKAPSVSALTQARKKLTPEAMPELLREFLSRFDVVPYLGRYRLLAVDGTGVGIARNADKRTEVTSNQYGRHRNEMHPTLLFDPVRRTFEDMVVQGSKVQNEPAALVELIARLDAGRGPDGVLLTPLWLADRNYTNYNTLWHIIDSGGRFCMRCRDDWARTVLGEDFVEGEFDVTVDRYLTRSRVTARRHSSKEARVIDPKTRLDPLPKGSKGEVHMRLRFVRVEIPASEDGDPDEDEAGKARASEGEKAESGKKGDKPKGGKKAKGCKKGDGKNWLIIVTNLSAEDFGTDEIVALYRVRWSEEVGIRFLKHTCGMKDPRCRDYERAEQEIWGRVILASACALAMAEVEKPEPGPKHEREVDVTMAFKAFLRKLEGRVEVDLEAVCKRYTHSVRPDRHFERRLSKESRVSLTNRH